jgi:hypothetical protein
MLRVPDRVKAAAVLLLPKALFRSRTRGAHDGKLGVRKCSLRCLSDGSEFVCDSGEVVAAIVSKTTEMLIDQVDKWFETTRELPEQPLVKIFRDNDGVISPSRPRPWPETLG